MRKETIIDLAINDNNIYTHEKSQYNIEWADNLRMLSEWGILVDSNKRIEEQKRNIKIGKLTVSDELVWVHDPYSIAFEIIKGNLSDNNQFELQDRYGCVLDDNSEYKGEGDYNIIGNFPKNSGIPNKLTIEFIG